METFNKTAVPFRVALGLGQGIDIGLSKGIIYQIGEEKATTTVSYTHLALAGCFGSAGRADAPDSETETGGAVEPYNVVISVFYVGTVPKDLELVEEAINKITVDAIDCTVTLLPISASEASAKFSLWVSNGEKIDLMSSFPLDLGTCIANNSVVQLDDLLSEHAPYILSLIHI